MFHQSMFQLLTSLSLTLLIFKSRVARAATIKIQIPASAILLNPNTLPCSTHAVLTSGKAPSIKSSLLQNNTIEFHNIQTTGSHLLDIYTKDYTFAPYRIDISNNPSSSDGQTIITQAFETYRGVQWSDHGIPLVPSTSEGGGIEELKITAKCLSNRDFYEVRQGFNVLTLFKNPMILMGILALAFTFGMPKLMENMDPEMKAEYEEMQKKGGMAGLGRAALQAGSAGSGGAGSGGATPAAPQGFDLAGFLAGRQSGQGARNTGSERITTSSGGGDGIRERKR